MQSAWAVGWGLSVIVYTVVFSVASPDLAWRIMFWAGVIPAVLVLWIRRSVQESPIMASRERPEKGTLAKIFHRDHLRTTLFAAMLATGCQGGYYTLSTWLPTYLKKTRGSA